LRENREEGRKIIYKRGKQGKKRKRIVEGKGRRREEERNR
jgi:hypothetical protein